MFGVWQIWHCRILKYRQLQGYMHSTILRAGLDQESRPIFPLETLKSSSLIGRRIEANLDEFRLGVKAITKY
jgi:hypothetical protein